MKKFEELYRENYPAVYSFLRSLTNSHETAEELTQETFLKALKGIKGYQGECKITTWLLQIAKNTYFTYYKKQQRKLEKEQYKQEIETVVDGPEKQVMERERQRQIRAMIEELEEPYQDVVLLHLYGELSFLEISKQYGKSESWARVVFHRAKSKIKKVVMEVAYEGKK